MFRLTRPCVATLSLCLASAASGQTLTITGPCPGLMTFQVNGVAPIARVYFIHAANTGSWTIPPLQICGGTTTGLAAPVTLVPGFITSDAFGNATATFNVPAAACGNRWAQAGDSATCNLTNVALIL